MPFSLYGKIAVITGGGSGIGKSIAKTFAQHGAAVCVLDINAEAAKTTVDEIHQNAKHNHCQSFACNVTNQEEVINVFQTIYHHYKRLDLLVNSAGIAHVGRLENTSEADFDRLFQINVKGVYNAMRAAIPFMKEQKQGVILNIASVAAGLGLSDRFAYSMSKGAVVSMTLSVAKDYIHDGIRCNCISPGRVHTPFVDGFLKVNYPGKEAEMFEKLSKTQPIGRMAQPEEVANLALYLCSDAAAFITGSDYPIDGGFIRLNT